MRQLNPRVPLDLETIVLKCLRKDPAQRYGTAEALAQDLRRFARGDPIEARPPTFAERLARRMWRHRGKVAAAAAILLLLVALGWLAYDRSAESHRRKVAEYDQNVVNAVVKLQASGAFVEHSQGLMSDSMEFDVGLLFDDLGWSEDAFIVSATEILERSSAAVPGRPEAYYHLARALLLSGKEDQALQALSHAVDLDFVPAMVLKASLHQRRGEFDASKTLLDLARNSGQDTWAQSWIAAQLALAERRWTDAASEYGQLIELAKAEPSPYVGSPVEIYLGCGIARLRLEEYDAARENFVVACALCPGSVEPELLLGYTHLAEGNEQKADEAFEGLYARRPADDVAQMITSFYVLNFIRFDKGLYWAERIQGGYLRELWRAMCLRWLGRSDEALAAANELMKRKPDVALSYFVAASVSLDRYEWADAERLARQSAELAPDSAAPYVLLGATLRAQGKQERGVEMLQKAVEVEPDAPIGHFHLGVAYAQMGQLEQAAQSIKTAVEFRPDTTGGVMGSGAPHLLLGDILEKLGKPQKSLEMFEEAVRRARDFEWVGEFAELLPLLARAQFVTGRPMEAIQTLERKLADPRTATATIPPLEEQLDELCQALLPDLPTYRCIELALLSDQNEKASENHADKVLRAFREVAKGPDAAARIAYLEGRILQRKKQHEAAVEHLSVAVDRDPVSPEPLLALVQNLRAMGRSDEAHQQLRDRLAGDCPRNIQLWNSWLAICWIDHEQSVQQVLAEIPCQSHDGSSPTRFAHSKDAQASARYLDELHWLLDRLLSDEPVRINCGGDRYERSSVIWGRDRFYTRGSRYRRGQRTFEEEIQNTQDDPLYQTERYFAPSAYTPAGYLIPLPPGKYRVDLHFAEIGLKDAGQRVFDVVLEGERVLADFDPGEAGFAAAQSKSFTVSVVDGLLEIMFEFQLENPKVSAIEVRQTDER